MKDLIQKKQFVKDLVKKYSPEGLVTFRAMKSNVGYCRGYHITIHPKSLEVLTDWELEQVVLHEMHML